MVSGIGYAKAELIMRCVPNAPWLRSEKAKPLACEQYWRYPEAHVLQCPHDYIIRQYACNKTYVRNYVECLLNATIPIQPAVPVRD